MNRPQRLFGTDGIRGRYGAWPLTDDVIAAVSRALGGWLRQHFPRQKNLTVIIGKDPRASGDAIEQLLARGLRQAGILVQSCGVVPTPGLAYLTNTLPVQLGIMISASHNPAEDNGIKCFAHNGFKLSERQERAVERRTFALLKKPWRGAAPCGKIPRVATTAYLGHIASSAPGLNLTGMTIAIDCAHGAVSAYAEQLFRGLGATVRVIHDRPDGLNINHRAGSLHPQHLAALVRRKRADVGFSFDGDGDRVICCDEQGIIRDGDFMMAIAGRYLKERGRLKANTLVSTSMSNFGLEKFLAEQKIKMRRADVGDKYVLQQMQRCGSNLGGEQSGHIIFLDYSTTGDGLLTAVQLVRIMRETGKKLSALARSMKKYPQILLNVRVRERRPFKRMPVVQKLIRAAQQQLTGNGRLVVRYSGTEPLARVMVEGPRKNTITNMARTIIAAIQQEIGADG